MQTHKIIPQFVPYWDDEEKQAVLDVLKGDYLNEHKTVREFEREFAKFVNANYCVAVTSGTMALWLAIQARKEQGIIREIINIPDLHGIFAYNASKLAGIKYIDVIDHNPYDNFALPIHVNGRYSGIDSKFKIEDSCQAIDIHTKGYLSCYSFASTKHLTTLGQGGAVCCDSQEEYEILVRLKDHGRDDRAKLKPVSDKFDRFGINLKFTEAQAAFGLIQLRKLEDRLDRLSEIYGIYKSLLCDKIMMFNEVPKWYIDIYFKDRKVRDLTHNELKKHGIMTRIYNAPLHRQPFINKPDDDYPNACYYVDHGLFLPSTTNLSDDDIHYICSKINKIIEY